MLSKNLTFQNDIPHVMDPLNECLSLEPENPVTIDYSPKQFCKAFISEGWNQQGMFVVLSPVMNGDIGNGRALMTSAAVRCGLLRRPPRHDSTALI